MNKILIAATFALAASSSLAFARITTPPSSFLTTEQCTSVERTLDNNRSHYKSEAAFQLAEQKAMSLCRWDRHHNGGGEYGMKLSSSS